MDARKFHEVWLEQCDAAQTIKLQYGVRSAFDYLVGEKLFHFTEAAAAHPEFARALPKFVARVRRLFTPEEMRTHLARLEREQSELDPGQFTIMKELLTAAELGTS
jgi:hypothetical protein